MAHALTPAAAAPSLKDLPRTLHFQTGAYEYEFDRSASGLEYKARNGQQSASVVLNWFSVIANLATHSFMNRRGHTLKVG